MLFIFERQYLSIFGNNLHLKDRKHDYLKVSGINALDVCLLNEEGAFLAQLHLVYKRLEVWCIYAESVLLFA